MIPDRDAIAEWFELIYAGLPGHVSVFTLPAATSGFFGTDELDMAADYTAMTSGRASVYAGCCTLTHEPAEGRGGAADTLAMPGLWADLDVATGGHHKWRDPTGQLTLPPTVDDALLLCDDLGLEPTAIVHSGGGCYPWWLWQKPWVFTSDEDRAAAASLSVRFGNTIAELGRRTGWHVDSVSNLDRILRPVGSVNRKQEPKAVTLMECHPERRYTPAQVAAVIIDREPIVTATRPGREAPRLAMRGAESPAEAFSRIVPWSAVLEPVGLSLMFDHSGVGYWHHPASTTGRQSVSATTDHGAPVVVVWSESAAAATGLPPGTGQRLTKFRAWATLHYGGDESAAARAIRAMGRRTA